MAFVHVRRDGAGSIFHDGRIEYGVSYTIEGPSDDRVWVLLANKPLNLDWVVPIAERVAAEAEAAGVRIAAGPPFEDFLREAHPALMVPDDHPTMTMRLRRARV